MSKNYHRLYSVFIAESAYDQTTLLLSILPLRKFHKNTRGRFLVAMIYDCVEKSADSGEDFIYMCIYKLNFREYLHRVIM